MKEIVRVVVGRYGRGLMFGSCVLTCVANAFVEPSALVLVGGGAKGAYQVAVTVSSALMVSALADIGETVSDRVRSVQVDHGAIDIVFTSDCP